MQHGSGLGSLERHHPIRMGQNLLLIITIYGGTNIQQPAVTLGFSGDLMVEISWS
jgi:hypothetical protein